MRIAALAFVTSGLGLGPALAQEQPRFPMDVDAVFLDVFVSRGNQALTGLRAPDFEVLDEGVRQQVRLVAADEAPPLNAILVLDNSGSVQGATLEALKAASRSFLEGIPGDGRASLITFSHTVRLVAGPAPAPELLAPLSRVETAGGTALNDALFTAFVLSQSTGGRSLVVAFTDGVDSASWLGTSHVRAMARESDTITYIVGIDPSQGESGTASPWKRLVRQSTRASDLSVRETRRAISLREIAEETGGRLLLSKTVDALREAFASILAESRTRYLLSFSPPDGAHAGWHALTVRLRNQTGEVRARRGYVKRGTGDQRDR